MPTQAKVMSAILTCTHHQQVWKLSVQNVRCFAKLHYWNLSSFMDTSLNGTIKWGHRSISALFCCRFNKQSEKALSKDGRERFAFNINSNSGHFCSAMSHQQGWGFCTLHDQQKCIHLHFKNNQLYSIHHPPTHPHTHTHTGTQKDIWFKVLIHMHAINSSHNGFSVWVTMK